jgi:phosphoribosyl 1,2-cyclic phosphodiesterase
VAKQREEAGAFTVTFWGVRGSHPVCGSAFLNTGGDTTCVEVRAGGHVIVIDAGTGIIELGRRLAAEAAENPDRALTLLLTHTHYDHTMGFPFFTPAYRRGARLHLYGPSTLNQSFQDILTEAMVPPVFPVTLGEMPAAKVIETIAGQDEVVWKPEAETPVVRPAGQEPDAQVRVRVYRCLAHPVTGCFVYRVEYGGRAFVFATDVEGYRGGDRRLIEFARGADLLVHDAQYTEEEYGAGEVPRQGWGHSTVAMACEVAREAGVGRLLLTHHDPVRTDADVDAIEQAADRMLGGTGCARKGMTVRLA